jgi:stress response protein YsnF
MTDELRIPIVEETAQVFKRATTTDRVRVRTTAEEHPVTISEQLFRGHVVSHRVPVEQEITETPPIRTEGEVTIVPIVEERLVVEKRLFLVEELHLTRETVLEHVEIPEVLRRTRVDIEREEFEQQENH